MTKRMHYKRFAHYDYLSDKDMEEDLVNVPSIEKNQYGGYKRHAVTNYDE